MIENLIMGDCLDVMKSMKTNSIDLTVTSPPYDNLRTYKGYSFDFEPVARELYRVTKIGGVVVWVVGDATINGSETGTSFRQALYFKECGFNLHDTMIYHTSKPPMNDRRYQACFEYMFVFSKGSPKTCNLIREASVHAGKKVRGTYYNIDGSLKIRTQQGVAVQPTKVKNSIWYIVERQANGHPATFPTALARDHIITWSNEKDLVFDPFVGSGTTAEMALRNNRRFIGCDVSAEYIEMTKKRLNVHNLLSDEKETL